MALSYEEFVEKAADQTLTVREAIEYAMTRPTTSENHFKQLRALRNTWDKTGLPEDITLAEMRKQDNWSRLGKNINKHSNKYGNFQALETNIRPIFEEAGILNLTIPGPGGQGQIKVYPLITGGKGSGSLSGGAQRTDLAGERPMRGLIPQDDIEKIYSEAIPKMRAEYGDAVADLAEYHKATFQRPKQLIGDSAITKADVTITDEFVTIKGVTKGTKTRPTVKYPIGSPIADLVIRNYESTKSEKLFDVNLSTYDEAYRATISPKLVAGFEDMLPLFDANDPSKGVISSPSATRSFMVRILTEELGYPDDVAEVMMGHKDSSILTRNYRGLKPNEGMGKIIDSLLIGVRDGFGGFGDNAANFTANLTEEERRELAKAQVAEAKDKTETYLSDALEKQKTRVAYLESPEGQKLLAGIDALERQEITRKVELQQFEADERARVKADAVADASAPIALDDDGASAVSRFLDKRLELAKKLGKNKAVRGVAKFVTGPYGTTAIGTAGLVADTEADEARGYGIFGTPLETSKAIRTAQAYAPVIGPALDVAEFGYETATETAQTLKEDVEKRSKITDVDDFGIERQMREMFEEKVEEGKLK